MTLSKSQYIKGLQCHKYLWLQKKRPDLKDEMSSQQDSLYSSGMKVGDLAKELFPDGKEIVFDKDNFNAMLEKTKSYIAHGEEVIYEATFSQDGVFCMADILIKNGDVWDVYEVKGSTHVKDVHVDDASVQWYTLSKQILLGSAYIVHINNQYVREDSLDVQQLFSIVDITEQVLEKQVEIEDNLSDMNALLLEDMPDIDIGTHCSNPYACEFHDQCWKHIPKDSVFDISYAMGKQWQLYYQGIVKMDDVPEDFHFGKNATMQLKHHKSQEIHIEKEKISDFLETITYPINFFDFETFQEAIPRFNKQRPYAQMPFQYSLHILYEDGRLEHKEFLADECEEPRELLIKHMLQDITKAGSIVAFNQAFEKTQIKNLALFFPEETERLLALNERFVDLAHPFQKKWYYHPKFNGRYSIKVVLPTLFPNDDELDYKKLGSVQNGGDAMDTFANLHRLEDFSKRDEIRDDLLKYCHLDTLAMVRIWEKLRKIAATV